LREYRVGGAMTWTIAQIKLHRYFGGGEVFSRSLCEAVAALGGSSLLVTHPGALHWQKYRLPATRRVLATSIEQALAALPAGVPLITHAPLAPALAEREASRRVLIGIVHMPFDRYGAGGARAYRGYRRVAGVSQYVRATLAAAGIEPHAEPLLGYADFERLEGRRRAGPLVRTSEFEWDRRKMRDLLLAATEPVWQRLRRRAAFRKRAGCTLAVVSRIAPIKQFPLLFSRVAGRMASIPDLNLEVFGAGGYASVRDTRRALAPMGARVRFWGHQDDVAAVYRQVDVLLTGLPEREALGLNVIEAQACGVPVLAVGAPPFTETILDGRTGWLYRDPREDEGEDFGRVLASTVRCAADGSLPDPRLAADHLATFSKPEFTARVGRLLEAADALRNA
jgi:glycosyltransferase involved in cell wall biosynthesis